MIELREQIAHGFVKALKLLVEQKRVLVESDTGSAMFFDSEETGNI